MNFRRIWSTYFPVKSEQCVIKLDCLTFEGGYARLRSDPGWEMGGGGVSDKERKCEAADRAGVVLKSLSFKKMHKVIN